MTTVTLSLSEVLSGATIGITRQLAALKRGLPDRHGMDPGNGWTVHIEGACGEIAVAKALGAYWSASVNTFKQGGDVGSLQVRSRSRDDYDLIVRDSDDDAALFVLVTGTAPHYRVRGWIKGSDAKQPEYLREHGNRPAAYFVPADCLDPSLDALRAALAAPTPLTPWEAWGQEEKAA